ncbi:uncharacterized protein B0H64DRAFT_45173 [Chaetomium fimeti]|uniref:Uncharacterized protein n=1 Tax=Chaetomium fimeti TaxID=1854472 RepID=A0AAE0H7I1_9PEZI|nr:hypothetical protein B0H64DRAFT_45173 [Chaetomium fimeti]
MPTLNCLLTNPSARTPQHHPRSSEHTVSRKTVDTNTTASTAPFGKVLPVPTDPHHRSHPVSAGPAAPADPLASKSISGYSGESPNTPKHHHKSHRFSSCLGSHNSAQRHLKVPTAEQYPRAAPRNAIRTQECGEEQNPAWSAAVVVFGVDLPPGFPGLCCGTCPSCRSEDLSLTFFGGVEKPSCAVREGGRSAKPRPGSLHDPDLVISRWR